MSQEETPETIVDWYQVVRNNAGKEVNLRSKGLICDDAKEVARALCEPDTVIETVHLTGNSIGPEGAAALAQALMTDTTAVQTLHLSNNELGHEGVKALASALKINTMLRTLNVQQNAIGDTGAIFVAAALQTNGTLQRLDLQCNDIEVCGAVALADSLKGNETLQILELEYNTVGDDGAIAIAESLKGNTVLQQLNLSFNGIGDKGAAALAEALEGNQHLETLKLEYNDIGDSGAVAFAKALEKNASLQSLVLKSNDINSGGGETLAEALKTNETLQLLNLENNNIEQDEVLTRDITSSLMRSERVRFWYDQGLREGSTMNNRVRIMMSGPFCVGKTNLIRRLKGQEFDPSYDSTVGIDTEVGYVNKESLGADFSFTQLLVQWQQEVNKSPQTADISMRPAKLIEDSKKRKNVKRIFQSVDDDIVKTRETSVKRRKCHTAPTKTPILLSAWDFAGQIRYHDMHQMFFRSDCIYILVLDLREDEDRTVPARPEKAMLDDAFCWLNAIMSSAGTDIDLVIVGTHADDVGDEEAANARLQAFKENLEERSAVCEARESLIMHALSSVVDNKSGRGVEELRTRILDTAARLLTRKKMRVPLRWLRLLEALSEEWKLPSGSFCFDLAEITTRSLALGFVEPEEVTSALIYLDQIGEIVYKDTGDLRNWVFPKPHHLLSAMKTLVRPPTGKQTPGLLRSQSRELDSSGYLPNKALTAMWTSCKFQNQEQLRQVLKEFGLLMDMDHGVVIPSRLPSRRPEDGEFTPRHMERFLTVEVLVSTHVPPGTGAYILSQLHQAFGVRDQNISLLSRTSSLLRLETARIQDDGKFKAIKLRLLVLFDSQLHSISFRIGATPTEITGGLADDCLLATCQALVPWVHQQTKQQYPSLTTSCSITASSPKDGCGGKLHTWSLPRKSTLETSDEAQPWTHTCCHANEFTLYDAIERPSKVELPVQSKHRVFLSHTGQDLAAKLLTAVLYEKLKQTFPWDVFYDTREIEKGSNWKACIEKSVQQCDVFVCIYSRSSCHRFWCMHELDLAILADRTILPIYLDGVEPPSKWSESARQELSTHHRESLLEGKITQPQCDRWLTNLLRLDSTQAIRRCLSDGSEKDAILSVKEEIASELAKILSKSTPTPKTL